MYYDEICVNPVLFLCYNSLKIIVRKTIVLCSMSIIHELKPDDQIICLKSFFHFKIKHAIVAMC